MGSPRPACPLLERATTSGDQHLLAVDNRFCRLDELLSKTAAGLSGATIGREIIDFS
jgi:hypothetical protein